MTIMNALAKAIDTIKKFRQDIETEVDNLEAQREALKREREDVKNLPIPREDAIRRMESLVDHWQRPYEERIGLALIRLSSPEGNYDSPNVAMNPLVITSHEDISGGVLRLAGSFVAELDRMTDLNLHSLMGLLGPTVIKQRLREIMEAMAYPDQVGLPMAERPARLEELDKQIRELDAKIGALLKDAREAGIEF